MNHPKPRMRCFKRYGMDQVIWTCTGENDFIGYAHGTGLTPEAAYAEWLLDYLAF